MNPEYRQLQAIADEFEAELRVAREHAEQVAQIQGEAQTPDGAVRVRANAMGIITAVTLGPTTRHANREWLGQTIVDLTAAAAQQAVAQADAYDARLRRAQRVAHDRLAEIDPVQAQRLRKTSDVVRRNIGD